MRDLKDPVRGSRQERMHTATGAGVRKYVKKGKALKGPHKAVKEPL